MPRVGSRVRLAGNIGMNEPTLLMIHGIVGSLHYFDPQSRMPGVNVINEDLLGYGRYIDFGAERLTLAAQADHVARCIDELPTQGIWLLGHSMGGAVAVLAADLRPDRVCGIINVEGNLTEKDTFWSKKIAAKTPEQWELEYREMVAGPGRWIARCGVKTDQQRTAWTRQILDNQPAATLYAMSKALLEETLCPEFLNTVRRVLDRGIPMHLVAGAKSAADWGVPDFVRQAAASYTEQPDAGHLMMLEAPDAFCEIVASLLTNSM